MLLRQGSLGGVIKQPPTGTTPTTIPGGGGVPQLPPAGPPTVDRRIPQVGVPFPRTGPYPGGGRYPDDRNRFPDNRPDGRSDPRFPDTRNPGQYDPRYPDTRNSDPSYDPRYPDPRYDQSGRRRGSDPVSTELDALYKTGDLYLTELAETSGGKLYRADDLYSLPDAFEQIAGELRTQYALGYYPTNSQRDGTYRKIQVRTTRKDVVVRARPGYRAPSS